MPGSLSHIILESYRLYNTNMCMPDISGAWVFFILLEISVTLGSKGVKVTLPQSNDKQELLKG